MTARKKSSAPRLAAAQRNTTASVDDAQLHALLAEHNAIYDTLTAGIAALKNRVIVNCNLRFAEIFGYEREALLGSSTRALYPSEEDYLGGRNKESHPELMNRATSVRELRMRRKDGSIFWMSSRLGAIDRRDFSKGVIWLTDDITERRHTDQLLRLEHRVARCLTEVDNASAALKEVIRAVCETQEWDCGVYWALDAGASVLRFGESWSVANPAIEHFVEKSRATVYGPGIGLAGKVWQSGELLWVADTSNDASVLRKGLLLASGTHGAFVFPVVSEGAPIGVFTFSSREVREPDERLLETVSGIGSQIGQFLRRQRTERELRASEQRFRRMTALSSDWYWEQDAELRFTVSSGDSDASAPIGKCRWDTDALPVAGDWSEHRRVLERREPFRDFQTYRDLANGSRRYMSIDGEPIFDAEGRFAGYRGVVRDITATKRDEELLRLEHTVTRCLADGDDWRATLKEVLRVVCEAEGWDCGRYWSVDEQAGVLRFAEGWSVPGPETERFIAGSRGATLAPGSGLAGHVWQSGESVWVPDVTMDARVVMSAVARSSGIRGAFLFPVLSEGKTIGVLNISSRQVREPDSRLLQAVRVIGSQIGQFLRRKHAEEVLRESEERFRGLTKLSSDWYWEQDEEFRFTFMSTKHTEGAGVADSEVLGKRRWEMPTFNMTEEDWARHRAGLGRHEPFYDLETCRADADGERRWLSTSGQPIFDEHGAFKGYRGIGKDITARKLTEERIQYLATHDGLTGLPNRALFGELLSQAIQRSRRYGGGFAVLFLDLDGFKAVNDTLGHEAGDTLLKEIAQRLTQTLRESDIVARMGGDEFVVLIHQVTDGEQVALVARKLLAAVLQPVIVFEQECRVTASIGIALFPTDAQNEQLLLKYADTAMYRAKEEGKNNFQFHSVTVQTQSLERRALETSLRRALERNEFLLHYQAKLDLKNGKIAGVEALLRWQHPELGMVSPAQFIPLAEETGLIVPIGRWVLRTACLQNVAWQREGLPPFTMAVNLSARQLSHGDLLQDIEGALRESGMAPALLELELAESLIMQDPNRTIALLSRIKQLGVRLAIDDFGVGYSSLAQIKHFPIDTLKVDRSFIRDLNQSSDDQSITKAIIAMGKSLNLTVIAEGVESADQETFLRDHACDEMQGYFFNKPVPSGEIVSLLRRHAEANEATPATIAFPQAARRRPA